MKFNSWPFILIISLVSTFIVYNTKLSAARRELFEGNEKIKELEARLSKIEGKLNKTNSDNDL